jgi:hypothetical protein
MKLAPAKAMRGAGKAPLALALLLLATAGALAWLLRPGAGAAPPAKPEKSTLHATPATLSEVFAGATRGDTILLAPGDYGTFTGGVKPAPVTIRPEPGVAARMNVQFRRVANVRLDGLTIDGAEIGGRARHVTIARSTFAGPVLIRADQMADAGIVLEGNRLPGIDVCPTCYEGRIQVVGDAGRPSGVVIRDNVLGPGGNADGIQVGGNGVQILGNTFVGIDQGEAPDAPHTDALQLYGQRNTVIRGNYFHDVSTGIMAPDGGNHERIEENVFDTSGYPYAIMLGGDDGSLILHNTMPDFGSCSYEAPCGTLLIGDGPSGAPSRGTVVRDNILGRLSVNDGSQLAASERNLIAIDGGGPTDLTGAPVFAGGAHPTSRDGFALIDGSPGDGGATDGADIGVAPRRSH